jgi:hypothetical protein
MFSSSKAWATLLLLVPCITLSACYKLVPLPDGVQPEGVTAGKWHCRQGMGYADSELLHCWTSRALLRTFSVIQLSCCICTVMLVWCLQALKVTCGLPA